MDLASVGTDPPRWLASGPTDVALIVTNRCNLRCRHCVTACGASMPEELDTAEMLALVRRLGELKVFRVTVTGGEPLVREDLFQILDELQAQRVAVSFLTNGTLVDEQVARRLAGYRFLRSVSVSLDGGTARDHDRLRGSGTFEQAIAGICRLLRQGLAVGIGAVVTRENMDRLEKIVQLGEELGVSGVSFKTLFPAGRLTENADALFPDKPEMVRIAQTSVELEQRYRGFVRSGYSGWWSVYHRELDPDAPARRLLSCSTAKTSCTIRPDGQVIPCGGLWDLTCGDVRQQDLLAIWQDAPVLNRLRDLSVTPVDAIEECRDCRFNSVCTGGCRAEAWLATGQLLGLSPYCLCEQLG